MAEPKDDPDAAHFTQKVANHLGNSRLEENLNDFFELYHVELRGELYPRSGFEGGGHSLRMHELYQKFLGVVKANLEEFLQAEGLTEAELRDACEKETELEGLNIMQTLTSSWEISSFVALASDFVEEEGGPGDYDHHNNTTLETEASTICVDSSLSPETGRIINADKRGAIGDQPSSPVCHGGCCYRSGRDGRCLVKAGDATGDYSRNGSREYNAGLELVDHHALQCEPVVAARTPLESWVLQDESVSTEAQEKI